MYDLLIVFVFELWEKVKSSGFFIVFFFFFLRQDYVFLVLKILVYSLNLKSYYKFGSNSFSWFDNYWSSHFIDNIFADTESQSCSRLINFLMFLKLTVIHENLSEILLFDSDPIILYNNLYLHKLLIFNCSID